MSPSRLHRIIWPILTGLVAIFILSFGLPLIHASPAVQTTATLRVDPATQVVAPTESFTVAIRLDQAQSLGGFEFDLEYDHTVVQVVTITIGNFLATPGRQVITLGPLIDNHAGRAAFGAVSYGTGPGANGSDGLLATVRLNAQNAGSTSLTLTNTQLVSTTGTRQPSTTQAGSVIIQTGLGTINGSAALQGRNQCDAIQVVWDTELPVSRPCSFTLVGIPAGIHRVSLFHTGYLSTTRANVLVSASQTTTLPAVTLLAGDTNGDGVVDIVDLVTIGIAYGSSPPSIPQADINGDGAVTIVDLTLLGINYLKRAPTPW